MEETLDLGPCCVCERTGPSVRNIITLGKKSPLPGHGWGCVVCHLSSDGALAVICDDCAESHESAPDISAWLRFACRGYPGSEGRVPLAELAGEHKHDAVIHAAEGEVI